MRSLKFFSCILVLVAAGCSSNTNDQSDSSSAIEIRSLGNIGFGADLYSCNKDCYNKLISKKDTSFFINTLQDYSKLITTASCLEISPWPDVDFSSNSLLAGVAISSTSCATLQKETLVYDPFAQKYTFIVILQQGSTPAFSAVFFWALTNKISSDAKISFEVKYSSIQ